VPATAFPENVYTQAAPRLGDVPPAWSPARFGATTVRECFAA